MPESLRYRWAPRARLLLVLRAALVQGPLVLAACSDSPTRPGPQITEPLEIHASVNVQLQQAPAGVQPFYIVTGTASAEQGGIARATTFDSTVVDYSHNAGECTRLRRTTALPFSDVLPFTAAAGDVYRVRAGLYASAFDGSGMRHSASAEWVASAATSAPAGRSLGLPSAATTRIRRR